MKLTNDTKGISGVAESMRSFFLIRVTDMAEQFAGDKVMEQHLYIDKYKV